MTIREYVNELLEDLQTKWSKFADIWHDPANAGYENARFEWQLANTKYREFIKKLMSHPKADLNGKMDDIDWN